eukprot:m.30650 g.30650  ORF g.30650 m.30650 type:complete len:176 (-) comp9255_c0_seq1:114-641(-)
MMMETDDRKRPHPESDDDMEDVDESAFPNDGMPGGEDFPGGGAASQGDFNGAEAAMPDSSQGPPVMDGSTIPTDLLSEDLRILLESMDDFVPTIPDAVTTHYLRRSGFNTSDPRVIRLITLAAQKFITDVAQDAFQHCKHNRKASKEKDLVLTTADLSAALKEHGINIVKPPYFS